MITFSQYINEVNNKMMQYMQSLVPNWPPYIVSDLLYKGFSKQSPNQSTVNPQVEAHEFLNNFCKDFGYNDPKQMQWNLQNITITKDVFDDDTQKRMNERGMGKSNPYGVPNDVQRHQGASTRIQKNPNIRVPGYVGAASSEPIILVKWKNGKYALLEGWHRTIQMILAHPEGFQQSAYVLNANK